MRHACLLCLYVLLALMSASAFFAPTLHRRVVTPPVMTPLSMGILDSISSFIKDREGDFVKLEDSGSALGPGPLLLLFNLPQSIQIEDAEFSDMVEDGAPRAFSRGIIARINWNDASILDMSLSDALEQIVRDKGVAGSSDTAEVASGDKSGCPVLLFSGFSNEEMMATYNIVGKEIYEESGGSINPACAKAVPNAFDKPLKQVLEEIGGDHEEALSAE
jgi:hypothetical protein